MAERKYRNPALVTASAGLHAAAGVAIALVPQHWLPIAATVFADHLLLTGLSFWPQSPWLGANLCRLPAGTRREVALTFDDGPDPEVTPKVLDLLDRHGAKATFFAVGRRVEAHPEIAAEALRRGHRVENHSHTHPLLFSCYPPPALRQQIEDAQRAIEKATGVLPRLFRAPAGFRNPLLDRVLWQAGLALVSWTRRGYDTVERDPKRVASRLVGKLAAGDILVLHDDRPLVLEALPRVLDALAEKGLTSVPLPALTSPALLSRPTPQHPPGEEGDPHLPGPPLPSPPLRPGEEGERRQASVLGSPFSRSEGGRWEKGTGDEGGGGEP